MIKNEVDVTRKLVVARAEGELTKEDLRNAVAFWSRGVIKDYAALVNLGSADLSGLTLADFQRFNELFRQSNLPSVYAIVLNTGEQRQAADAFVQVVEQAGFPAGHGRIFDDEVNAFVWVVANHAYGN